jgi:CRP-like cAMP-binding protein
MADSGLGKWIKAPFEKEKPFLSQIPREAADFFILKSRIEEYDAGDIIIEGDSPGDNFYVLQSGRIQVCGAKYKGQWTEIAILQKGAAFGEMSIMSEVPVSNTIIALEDSTVLIMNRSDFIRFVTDNPGILILLYKILAERLRAKNKAYEAIIKTSLMGHFKSLAFVDVAQSFEKERTSGTMLISRDKQQGIIGFKKGNICYCECAGLDAGRALEEMLTWEDAWFSFDDTALPEKINLKGNTTGMILDALRNIDEKKLKAQTA